MLLTEVLEECQESWKAIVIDEFQDTSVMQYSLLRIIGSHKRITIVGDEDQVDIYIISLKLEIILWDSPSNFVKDSKTCTSFYLMNLSRAVNFQF